MSPISFLRGIRSHGLSLGTAQLLLDLHAHPGANPLQQVAARIGICGAAMTDLRDQLARKRLIFTPRPGYDRRVKGIALTAKGEAKVAAILQIQTANTQ